MNPILIIAVFVLLILAGLFFLKFRIVRLMHVGLQIAFPVFLILAVSALFVPQIYSSAADRSLQGLGVLVRIQELDHTIASFTNAPQNLIDQVQKLFNTNSPSTSATNTGYVEQEFYPFLTNILALVYRGLIFVLSLLVMAAIVYLSYSTASLNEVAKLKQQYEMLSKRLALLESKNTLPN